MKWKTFWQILVLIISTAIVFYIVYPKYYIYKRVMVNKITGQCRTIFGTYKKTQQESTQAETDKSARGFKKFIPQSNQ